MLEYTAVRARQVLFGQRRSRHPSLGSLAPRVLATFGLVSLTLALVGCSEAGGADAGAPVDAPPVTPTIELGAGEIEFVPVVDGQDLEVIRGAQNGFHFLGSVRVTGVEAGNPDDRSDPRNPTTEFRVFRGMDRVDLMASSYTQGLDPVAGADGAEMVGRFVILDIDSDAELDGMMVRIEVTVSATDGTTLQDERMVRAVPHPNN